MSDRGNQFMALLADLRRLVEGARTTVDLRPFAECVRKLGAAAVNVGPTEVPFGLPVCRFWQSALRGAQAPVRAIAAALMELGPNLTWTQNPNYRRTPPSERFLDNYGYAVIAGPRGGPPALLHQERCALGVLLLGPETVYPRHHHPATEIYVPLNAAEWWREQGPWRSEGAGTVIFHDSNIPHATRTSAQPLLAIYLWLGDLAIHARLMSEMQSCPVGAVADVEPE